MALRSEWTGQHLDALPLPSLGHRYRKQLDSLQKLIVLIDQLRGVVGVGVDLDPHVFGDALWW